MSNDGLPGLRLGDRGDEVRHLQRALRRVPDDSVSVDGIFGPRTEAAVRRAQLAAGLAADGVVGPRTWAVLPDGGPMPRLAAGSSGDVVRRLQQVLIDGAPGHWQVAPRVADGMFGPRTEASVEAFQRFGGVVVDGVVGDRTWSAPIPAGGDLETAVGLDLVDEEGG